jgi:cytochrome P450 family 6
MRLTDTTRYIFLFLYIFSGKRFAELEMKLALVEILSKFEVQTCERTEIPIKFSKKALIIVPENGIWLKFIEIKN